jgi:DNA-binding transcriptional regulator PaaX
MVGEGSAVKSRRERDHRYNVSEKGRARYRRYETKRRSDPEYRRRKTLYMIGYRHRRKRGLLSRLWGDSPHQPLAD